MLAIFLLGAFLRLHKLGEKSFVADEFLGANAAYGFMKTGQFFRWDFNLDQKMEERPFPRFYFDFDIWKGGPQTYVRAWAYNWQVSQSIKFLDPQKESSYRLVSALWGIILILAVYYVTNKITGSKKTALLASFFISISPMSIELSRKMRMYSMLAPVFLLFCYFLFNFLESKRETTLKFVRLLNEKSGFNFVYFLPMAALGMLSLHLHPLAMNIALVVAVYWSVMSFIVFFQTKKVSSKYSAYLGILAIVYSLLFFFSKEFASLPKAFLQFVLHFSYFNIIFSDYSSWMLAFILIVIGTLSLAKRNKEAGIFFATLFWLILFLAAFFWKSNVGDRFVYFIKPVQVILLASGLYAVVKYLKENLRVNSQKVAGVFLVFSLLAVPNFASFFGDDSFYVQNSRSSNPNYRKVFTYFINKKKDGDVLVTRNFRNFYLKGAEVKVYSLGGERTEKAERRIKLEDIQAIHGENTCGWLIFSQNDLQFISKEAEEYILKNIPKVDNANVRGPISVFRWCNQ